MVIMTVLWRWRSKAQDNDGHLISLILIACDIIDYYRLVTINVTGMSQPDHQDTTKGFAGEKHRGEVDEREKGMKLTSIFVRPELDKSRYMFTHYSSLTASVAKIMPTLPESERETRAYLAERKSKSEAYLKVRDARIAECKDAEQQPLRDIQSIACRLVYPTASNAQPTKMQEVSVIAVSQSMNQMLKRRPILQKKL
ncbi:hypothetical protein TRIUR3_30265 [Triticum urartu]|uniref:Uncharacterized protein n=2 Tax=Triticum urartu TaxID=4572 RepID=M7YC21_TRIUA|nr:hypothetical protein TRIUR3_30265 [Triticum urartu]